MQLNSLFPNIVDPRHRFRFFGLSLAALLLALHPETSPALRTFCIFTHFALILIWQPLWHGATALSTHTAAMLVAILSGLILWPGWLIITVWLLIIIGLLGGEHGGTKINRMAQGLAMCCLFITLLLNVVPLLFEVRLGGRLLQLFAFYSALTLAVILIVLPATSNKHPVQQIDYLRALSITFLALLLSSGTMLWMYRADIDYTEALFQTLLLIAVLIIVINWLWVSQSGHSIIQTVWNQYLLNLGTPFEKFLIFLSVAARKQTSPDNFLNAALANLLSLNWVTGITWSAPDQHVEHGKSSGHKTVISSGDVTATVYSRNEVGPAFVLHIQLLVHLVEHFYFALLHEAELETHLRLEAIHHTGARLTHDIKNLLQSMHYLTAVVEAATPEQAEESLQLLQRQFPELRQRMQLTLEKLNAPSETLEAQASAFEWWEQLNIRYAGTNIVFTNTASKETSIPTELFNNVAENLLENARYKQKMNKRVSIEARLYEIDNQLQFTVIDTGDPIDSETAKDLFRVNVSSKQGLGVGLYQSEQLANKHGYHLVIASNDARGVAIELRKTRHKEPDPQQLPE